MTKPEYKRLYKKYYDLSHYRALMDTQSYKNVKKDLRTIEGQLDAEPFDICETCWRVYDTALAGSPCLRCEHIIDDVRTRKEDLWTD